MKKPVSAVLEQLINNLTGKIENEVDKITSQDFLKNVTALKKVIDTVDKLVVLNAKLSSLKQAENTLEEDSSDKEKAMIENYFNVKLKQLPAKKEV